MWGGPFKPKGLYPGRVGRSSKHPEMAQVREASGPEFALGPENLDQKGPVLSFFHLNETLPIPQCLKCCLWDPAIHLPTQDSLGQVEMSLSAQCVPLA